MKKRKLRETQSAFKAPEPKSKFSLPRSLNVVEFAQARSLEIAQLTQVDAFVALKQNSEYFCE